MIDDDDLQAELDALGDDPILQEDTSYLDAAIGTAAINTMSDKESPMGVPESSTSGAPQLCKFTNKVSRWEMRNCALGRIP